MEKLGVISKVDEPTEWCAGMVVVPKSNGDVRICIDFTKLNESVKRENYPLPAVEESLAKLANARMFTKLDANSSFWQTNLAEESRPLTTFNTPFAQETAFTEIKNELASSGTLGHYDPNKDTVVSADASSFGLGAVIRQKHGEILKPVAYASRSMTDTEQRYAQIEKEALALTWACEKFSNYLISKKFNLETDHKPLVPLLSSKGIAELPPRIQRFRMRLLRFDFTIEHVPGKELNIADALSRAPVDLSESNEFETETKAYVDSIVNNFPASDMRLQNIRDECVKMKYAKP
ncbi:unnamed protein product [Mytilus coruscus]|uniref:Uncharacterized protein n=1 Tax=Mytilus coruscus TaxID=42192 RepID=A0A6J8CPZ0_MYTCO|nr:unnamed protein product [Mytilus coruscus]